MMDCIHPEIHIAARETRLAYYNKRTGTTLVAYDYMYDAIGNRLKMHDGTGRSTHSYDNRNAVRTVQDPANKTITFAYDAVGRRTLLIEPDGGRFTYVYDAAGRIDHLFNPQNDRNTWLYDAAGRVTTMTLANGTRAAYIYDAADRLTRLANLKSDGTVISRFDYGYDAVRNRTRVVEADGNLVTWTYDNTYQLTRERRSGADSYDVTYTYDPAGNRGTMLQSAVTTTYVYDAANELLTLKDSAGTTTYTYDADGNQLTQQVPVTGTTSHTWDYEDLLTRVHLPGGGRSTFTYNWQNKRVQIEDSGGTSKPLWDGDNLLLETDGADVTQVVNTLEPEQYGNQISQRRSAATHYYHFDGLGSTDRLTNASETVTDSYIYKAFGIPVTATGSTTNPFRYIGRLGYFYDTTTGLYHVRALAQE